MLGRLAVVRTIGHHQICGFLGATLALAVPSNTADAADPSG
jgi:hypothetical protein